LAILFRPKEFQIKDLPIPLQSISKQRVVRCQLATSVDSTHVHVVYLKMELGVHTIFCLFNLTEVVNFSSMMRAQYHYNLLVLPCYVCDNDPPVSTRDNTTIFSTFCPYSSYINMRKKYFSTLTYLVICCQCVPRVLCYYCHANKCITHAPYIIKQQLSGRRVNS